MIPGGGSDGDEIFIDDVELIYNTSGISENHSNLWVTYNESGLLFSNDFEVDEIFQVFTTSGTLIYSGTISKLTRSRLKQGMYLITNDRESFKVVAH